MAHPEWEWTIVSLCRRSDVDRAPKFLKVLSELGADGGMGNLDDGPDQAPVAEEEYQNTILSLLPGLKYSFCITHSPFGEYTRHQRHEETGRAVAQLWQSGRLNSETLWLFAYEDALRKYHPRAIPSADFHFDVPAELWERKFRLITQIYGFSPQSWEAQTTPRTEAFWQFNRWETFDTWFSNHQK